MQRKREAELMGGDALNPELHAQALRGLERVNNWSFTASAFWPSIAAFARASRRPIKVLDLATGGGDIPIGLWNLSQRDSVNVEIAGCDKSDVAIQYASSRAARANARIAFFKLNVLSDDLPRDCDVAISSLFLHHLDPEN